MSQSSKADEFILNGTLYTSATQLQAFPDFPHLYGTVYNVPWNTLDPCSTATPTHSSRSHPLWPITDSAPPHTVSGSLLRAHRSWLPYPKQVGTTLLLHLPAPVLEEEVRFPACCNPLPMQARSERAPRKWPPNGEQKASQSGCHMASAMPPPHALSRMQGMNESSQQGCPTVHAAWTASQARSSFFELEEGKWWETPSTGTQQDGPPATSSGPGEEGLHPVLLTQRTWVWPGQRGRASQTESPTTGGCSPGDNRGLVLGCPVPGVLGNGI